MNDIESTHYNKRGPSMERWNDKRFFVINYIVIAVLNLVQFSLTVYGRHKLDTDTDHVDLRIANWDALKLCLAIACLTWVFLAYGVIRRSRAEWIPFFYSVKKWDQVIANATIWILQLVAAADQTAFVNDYFHCVEVCDSLNSGSYSRNVAYAVFAWLLWVAWTPQLVWSSWYSRGADQEMKVSGDIA